MPKKKKKKNKGMAAGTGAVLVLALLAHGKFTSEELNTKEGSDRWAVKVLTDPGADSLHKFVNNTTIGKIDDFSDIDTKDTYTFGKKKGRMLPEYQVVRVRNVKIVDMLSEADKDKHLVIEDDAGNTMIAEAPDPNGPTASQSRWAENFNRVRQFLYEHRKKTDYLSRRFTITGPIFIDKSHGAKGAAPNSVEIHPILDISID